MAQLAYDRYYGAIAQSASEFADHVVDTDPALQVPTCPEWTFAQLTAHLGAAHRWSAAMVEQRSTEMLPFEKVEDLVPPEDAAERADWIRDGARRLVEAIHDAGTDTPVWTFAPDRRAGFWARRMAHETAIHGADAAYTAGRNVSLPADVSADGISEGLGLLSLPTAVAHRPSLAALRGDGETLHFHSTDGWLGRDGEWFVRRTPEGIEWQNGHEKADVAVRATAADLVLLLSGRISPDRDGITVFGDRALLDHWLEHTKF
jgi:uncharacterized protein (TIGR03083 family)